MAVAAATMFSAGAALTLIALVLPHGEGPDPVSDVITSAVALLCGFGVLKAGPRLRARHFHVLLDVDNVKVVNESPVLFAPPGGRLRRSANRT